MPELEARRVKRVLSAEEVSAVIGADVPALEANVLAPTLGIDAATEERLFVYLPVGAVADLRRAVLGIRYNSFTRATGRYNEARSFGYSPRRPVYGREGCQAAQLAEDSPDQHRTIERWATRLQAVLTEVAPDIADADARVLAKVDPSWRLDGSALWTSGIINQSSRLPYHRDRYNFPTWCAMPVLRRHMAGGYLHLPEYDVTLACRDGWAVLFPGHRLVHGVTPLRLIRPGGYRYSLVYYALMGMKDCRTAAEEAGYARRRRTERECEMARRLTAHEPIPR